MTEKSVHRSVEKQSRAGATEIEEFEAHPGLLLPTLDKKLLKNPTCLPHVFSLFQPSPRLNKLSIIRGNKEDLLSIGIENRLTKPLQQFLLLRLPLGPVLGRPSTKVTNEVNLYRTIKAQILHVWPAFSIHGIVEPYSQIRAVRGPRFVSAIKDLPDLPTKMGFPIACRAGENHRNRIGRRLVETVYNFLLCRMLEYYRLDLLPLSRSLNRLVVHVVISRHRAIMTKKLQPCLLISNWHMYVKKRICASKGEAAALLRWRSACRCVDSSA